MSFDHPKTLQILFKDTFFLFPIITSYNEINIKFDLSFTVTVSVLCPLIILRRLALGLWCLLPLSTVF
jgi:hypothetical protein